MRRFSICAAILVLALLPLAALDPDRGELESGGATEPAFVNYEGPQARIESAAAIRGIGQDLGRAIGSPRSGWSTVGQPSRYAVIRVIDPVNSKGFDADIFILGAQAQVDHIKNLRRIIAGYLETAWKYSARDADILAVFITRYNAVHRGELAYLETRYKAAVMAELKAENAGLALRWDEWAGKTRILIPLSSGARPGSLGAVDTGAVTEKAVVDSMRAEPDKGIGERQAMVDLKEREVDQKKAEVEEKKDEIKHEEAALAAQKDALAKERAALDAEKAKAAAQPAESKPATAPAAAPASADAAAAPEAAAAAEKPETAAGAEQSAELKAREEELAAKEAEVAAKETAIEEKKEELAKAEEAVAAKEAEVKSDRTEIAQDQKEVIKEQVAASGKAEAAGVYLFEVMDTGYPFARIVFVDAETGKLIRASALNAIRARSVLDAGEFFVAVAGKEEGTGAVRLVKVDKATLSLAAQGTVDLFAETALSSLDGAFFATVKGADGKHYLGRFGAGLEELGRSKEAVNPFGFISQSTAGLAVQAAAGGFLILDPASLDTKKKLSP